MSWDGYLDSLQGYAGGAANFERGCIISLDGGAPWTSRGGPMGLNIKDAEAQEIARCFKKNDFSSMEQKGIMLENEKFQYLRRDDDQGFPVILGKKKGLGAISVEASKTAIVIAKGPEGGQQGSLNTGVSRIVHYLAQNGL